jgi:putative phosphoesterase
MRIAIISDTHGYIDERIAAFVKQCDMCVHAGDIGGGSVLDSLSPRECRVIAVLGNNDTKTKWSAAEWGRLKRLPDEAHLDLPGGRLTVVHGHKSNPAALRHAKLRKLYQEARVIVYGHSHRLVIDQSDIPWVINPGAAGKSRTHGGPSFVTLHIQAHSWRLESTRLA